MSSFSNLLTGRIKVEALLADGSSLVSRTPTSTLTSVANSATNQMLLAANAGRVGASFKNTSPDTLYLKLGATATTSSYTVKIVSGGYYEVPFGYTGQIDGLWGAASSGVVLVDELGNPAPILLSAVSRKVHGGIGPFDIPINITTPIAGAIDVECRTNEFGHLIVFTFDQPIFLAGTPTSVDDTAAPFGTPSAVAVGNDVQVTITGAPDIKRAAISLSGVNGALSSTINIGFLVGDVTRDYSVTSSDINRFVSRNGLLASYTLSGGQPLFSYDLNLSGVIEGLVGLDDRNLCVNNSGQSI